MENLRVKSFPKDDKLRVVWWYGSMTPNTSAKSSNPLVKILLKEVSIISDDLVLSTDTDDIICSLPLPELDYVSIGSLWKDQQQLDASWEYNSQLELFTFAFDFSKHKPQSVIYKTVPAFTNKDSNAFDINPSTRSMYYNSQQNTLTNTMNKQQVIDQFYNTRLVKLQDDNGTTVFIPSFVYLSNAIFPRHKTLRRDIVNYPLDIFLSRHLTSSKIIDGVYHVETTKKLDRINATTLAYCALNPITRDRVKQINDSLQVGTHYDEKNPIVLPFHPSSLLMSGEGLWLDPERKTFLILRITSFEFPDDVKVKHISTFTIKEKSKSKNKSTTGDEDEEEEVEHEDPNSENTIEDNVDPGGSGPIKHMRSKVTIKFPKDIFSDEPLETKDSKNSVTVITDKIDEKETTPTNAHDELKDNHLSSGESSSTEDSKGIKRLEVDGPPKNKKPKENNLRARIRELEKLIGGMISHIRYVDIKGAEHENLTYCAIPRSLLSDDVVDYSWCYIRKQDKSEDTIKKTKKVLRSFVIMKVTLSSGKYAYFLEMERKKSEYHSGLCFKHSEPLTEDFITRLWSVIVANKGVFKRNTSDLPLMPLNVDPAMSYVHSSYDKVIVKLDSLGMFG